VSIAEMSFYTVCIAVQSGTTKEPGTPVPERDKRIPIGPTDV